MTDREKLIIAIATLGRIVESPMDAYELAMDALKQIAETSHD